MPYSDEQVAIASDALPTVTSGALGGDDVSKPGAGYQSMYPRWQLIDALMAGTRGMREARHQFLPQYEREPDPNYEIRLKNSFCYEAYKDTVKKLAAKPFAKPLNVERLGADGSSAGDSDDAKDLPPEIQELIEDADKEGTSLDTFARELFLDASKYGVTYVLVDYPAVQAVLNASEEKSLGVRPYFVHVSPKNVIGWRFTKGISGEQRLTQVRIYSQSLEPNGAFGEQIVEYITVYEEKKWMRFRKTPSDKQYVQFADGVNTLGEIPLIPVYFERTGFMTAEPPLEGLAYLNLAHWQSSSDQRNCLRVARFAILFMLGLSDDEQKKTGAIGPAVVIKSANENAKIGHAEPQGHALDAGMKDILLLEDQMQVMGLEPLMERAAPQTATGRQIDASKTHSAIQTWIRQLEDGLESAIEMAAKWLRLELSVEVSIFDDFGIGLQRSADLASLLSMRTAGEISRETFLAEVKRRGVLSDTVDVKDEIARVEAEGPSLSSMSDATGSALGMGPAGPSTSGAASGSAAAA